MTTTVTSRHGPAPARTAAANPFAPKYGSSADKDTKAIDSFLKQHWNVKLVKDDARTVAGVRTSVEGLVKKNGLDVDRFKDLSAKKPGESGEQQVLRAVYAYGVLAGERFALSGSKDQIELLNSLRKIKNLPPLELKVVEAMDFGSALESLTRTLSKAGFKAEPKGWAAYKKTANEFDPPGPEARTFKGRELHFSLGASIGGFGDTASRAGVFYNLERDRSTLNSLASAVFRQGMNLGVITLEKPLDAALTKARTESLSSLGRAGGDRFDR